jgi:hypothetical protein
VYVVYSIYANYDDLMQLFVSCSLVALPTTPPPTTSSLAETTPSPVETTPSPAETTPSHAETTPFPSETSPTPFPDETPPIISSGVHFSVDSVLHGNNSLVLFSEFSEDIPLLCVTDNTLCCGSGQTNNPAGEWLYPNRTIVQINSGFELYRTRREQTIQLHRRSTLDGFNGGIFECEVMNAAEEQVFSYIGVYPSEGGKNSFR